MPFDIEFTKDEIAERGYVRARDAAFYAVQRLWEKRSVENNLSQKDIAEFLGRDAAWVSRALRGPANWTMRTLGELVESLDGVIEIKVTPSEEMPNDNYDIYDEILNETKLVKRIETYMSAEIAESNSILTVTTPTRGGSVRREPVTLGV